MFRSLAREKRYHIFSLRQLGPRKYESIRRIKKKILTFLPIREITFWNSAQELGNENKVILVGLAALSSGCTGVYHALRNRLWLSATPSATTTYLASRGQIVSVKVREFSEKLGYRNRESAPADDDDSCSFEKTDLRT